MDKRLEAGRCLYNTVLGESLKRLFLMRQSKEYRQIRDIKDKTLNNKAYREIRERYGFREYDLHREVTKARKSWIGHHLDVHTAQKVASSAFQATEQYLYGKRGRPRFKVRVRMHSLEGKSNAAGIRYRDGFVCWGGLKLRCLVDETDPVIQHGLSCPIKYVRVVRKLYKGKNIYYAQLVCEGLPYVKEKNAARKEGIVGIDPMLSGVAAVSEDDACLLVLAPGIKDKKCEIRRLQRKTDRQRRAANPGNYNEDGTIKKGRKTWNNSTRYVETRNRVAELKRRETEQRRTENNRIANDVLRMGNVFNIEQNSFKAFQRNFGKTVGRRAPAGLINTIKSKAERAGLDVFMINAYRAKLSQTCICGVVEKKDPSQRWHICGCGAAAQRDLFSAFLARYADSDSLLDTGRAQEAWPGAEPLLRLAVSSASQRANGGDLPASFGISRRQSASPAEPVKAAAKATGVGNGACGGPADTPGRTPRL